MLCVGRDMSLAIVIGLIILRFVWVTSGTPSVSALLEVIWLFIPYLIALSIYSYKRITIFQQHPKDAKVWSFIAILNLGLIVLLAATENAGMGAAPILLLLVGFEYVISLCMVIRLFSKHEQRAT